MHCRYHKGLRHGSGVYKFKGLPPGGQSKRARNVQSDGCEEEEEEEEEEEDAQAAEGRARAKRAPVKKPEGGLFIGEWNAGFMQGLGVLKYDDGER